MSIASGAVSISIERSLLNSSNTGRTALFNPLTLLKYHGAFKFI